MKKFNLLAIISISFSMFVSCIGDLPENDNAHFKEVMNEALSTSVSENVINQASVSINSYIDSISKLSAGTKIVNSLDLQKSKSDSKVYPIVTIISNNINHEDPNIYNGITKTYAYDDGWPEVYVIDYGTDGYIKSDKKVYKGKIYYYKHDKASSVTEYVFSDFYINENKIEGNKLTFYNDIPNIKGVTGVFKISTTETIIPKGGVSYGRSSSRTRTNYYDGSISQEIRTSGVDIYGTQYLLETVTPVISIPNWKYFVSGSILTTTKQGTMHLDFGDGEKDSLAVRTINDKTPEKIILNW